MKYKLPNLAGSPSANNLTDEANQYQIIYNNINRTTSGVGTYTSASSGAVYSTNDYPEDAEVYNKGEEGISNLLAKYVLKDFMITEDDFNNKVGQEEIDEVTNNLQAYQAEYAQQLGEAELETTDKTLKGAINEVFTSGNNVKVNTVGALLQVDDSLPITQEDSWTDVINAIGQINVGDALDTPSVLSVVGQSGYSVTTALDITGSGWVLCVINKNSSIGKAYRLRIDGVYIPSSSTVFILDSSNTSFFLLRFNNSLRFQRGDADAMIIYTLD